MNITQSGDIETVGGQIYKADSKAMTSTKDVNLVVEDFKQLTYTDPNYNNEKLMYNLYVPKNYDSSKKYPLVLFMHDAGVVSNNPTNTLTQGLGAVVWAEPSEQAKNECFVLAPQYTSIIADDTSQTTDQMDITIDLVKQLEKQYSIDFNRIYNTGQSMGGMTSISMDIKYPDMFAASLLVACQWDPTKVSPMANKNLWIIVSEGDNKANPGEDAITEVLKKKGATVSKATWNAEASKDELATDVSKMLSSNCSINYTVFKGGSHRYTWQYAYTIEGVRDWLFKQVKK
ncbi:alpha/beta hydrolase-fold protein [Clostridium sp. BJN0013]|uniref:carboxylesterase family protein n=1 Tax=Clostridium sp. BJN0013 TaxID=3236840 RepID=UPI0034C5D2A0